MMGMKMGGGDGRASWEGGKEADGDGRGGREE